MRFLLIGLGASAAASATILAREGHLVVAGDDRHDERAHDAPLRDAGVAVELGPDADRWSALVESADVVVPSPGVAPSHVAVAAAKSAGKPLWGDVELAGQRAAERGLPIVAITGTNGKTTVTALVADMLRAGGHRVEPAGNIGLPALVALERDPTALVLEVSSFQLASTERFRPDVGVWLNFAPDHLDWHHDLHDYAAAKARLWANQTDDDLVVIPAADDVIDSLVVGARSRIERFDASGTGAGSGTGVAAASWFVTDGELCGPSGPMCAVADLPRALPHDLSNSLAAAAAAHALGVEPAVIAGVLREAAPGRHRVELVATIDGVAFVDDSKATNPHAAAAAARGFPTVVLIAGGRNKGLTLDSMVVPSVRAVVAIGESADEVERAFSAVPVTRASTMSQAVAQAAALANVGDTVLLAPGCASFDWYSGYAERGDDFVRAVGELAPTQQAPSQQAPSRESASHG